MTRGHLAVMEPFVSGNCHFPMQSGNIARVISNHVVLLLLLESRTCGKEQR